MLSGSPFSFSKVERRVVVEADFGPATLLSSAVERVVVELAVLYASRIRPAPSSLVLAQHAVEPAEHDERQHDALILRRAIRAAEQIGDLPDEVRQFVVSSH